MDMSQVIRGAVDLSAAGAVIVVVRWGLKYGKAMTDSFLKIISNHMQHETEASERLAVAVEKVATLVGAMVARDMRGSPADKTQPM